MIKTALVDDNNEIINPHQACRMRVCYFKESATKSYFVVLVKLLII
jgi:hypothetical protein